MHSYYDLDDENKKVKLDVAFKIFSITFVTVFKQLKTPIGQYFTRSHLYRLPQRSLLFALYVLLSQEYLESPEKYCFQKRYVKYVCMALKREGYDIFLK